MNCSAPGELPALFPIIVKCEKNENHLASLSFLSSDNFDSLGVLTFCKTKNNNLIINYQMD